MAAQSFHVIKCASQERTTMIQKQSIDLLCHAVKSRYQMYILRSVMHGGSEKKISEIKNTSIFFLHARFGHAEHQNYCDAIEMILYLLSTRFLTSVAAHDLCTQGNPQTMSLCRKQTEFWPVTRSAGKSLRTSRVYIVEFPVTIIHAKNVWCCGEGYFGQKKLAENVRKSRQNVNRDKSA